MLNAQDRVIVDGVPVAIGPEIAAAFQSGDRLFGVSAERVLHIPQNVDVRVSDTVTRASAAFRALQQCSPSAVSQFFDNFAASLEDDATVQQIMTANARDVERATARGRSTSRLVVTESMRADMVSALRLWRDASDRPDTTIDGVSHEGWSIDVVRAPLGVVAFVFEGRPNVFSDATGVLRMGNACVFRIGSDALETARAIMEHALRPSLRSAGLPEDAVVLVDEPSHASAWSLFSQSEVSLAVARGSGEAVRDLGAVARQSGIPVSLHGTGGAWMVVGDDDVVRETLQRVVRHSLDRKVCNTLNVVCLVGDDVDSRLRLVLKGVAEAAIARGTNGVVHDVTGACSSQTGVRVVDAELSELGREWEWETDPEITVVAVRTIDEAIALFNRYSPRFVLSIVSSRQGDHDHAWAHARAPFIGNGMTRWVDGQFALQRPELGLSNWELGAPIGRGAILSGGDVFTIRYRVHQIDPTLHR